MALSVSTVIIDGIEGINSTVYATIGFDAAYTTAGIAVTPAAFGLSTIKFLTISTSYKATPDTATVEAVYNAATAKIQLFSGGTEVANATALTNLLFSVRVLGA